MRQQGKVQEDKMRPKVFIGCSTESLKIAEELEECLRATCKPILWSKAEHGLSKFILEHILETLESVDFAVLVLTADDKVEHGDIPGFITRDNVLIELGLAFGKLGRKHTFVLLDNNRDLRLASDLGGMICARFASPGNEVKVPSIADAANLILAEIQQAQIEPTPLASRNHPYGFAICVPTASPDMDEFNGGLKHELKARLSGAGLAMLDYCPLIQKSAGPTGKHSAPNTLDRFRKEILALSNLHCPPKHLLVIWPGLCTDESPPLVLGPLRRLVHKGCRIALINEFPKFPQGDDHNYHDVNSALIRIRLDPKRGVELLCSFIANHIKPDAHVLVINATNAFQVARDRARAYSEILKEKGMHAESELIDTWDEADAYDVIRRKLQTLAPTNTEDFYDVVAAANDNMAIGAVKALDKYCEENNCKLKTKVVGYDGLPRAIKMIKNPRYRFVATITANPMSYVNTAWTAFDLGDDLLPINPTENRRKNPSFIPIVSGDLYYDKKFAKVARAGSSR